MKQGFIEVRLEVLAKKIECLIENSYGLPSVEDERHELGSEIRMAILEAIMESNP